jgi:MFS family permease
MRNILTRDFTLGFLTYLSFLFASFTLIPTLPIYLERLGSNETEIGVLVGVYGASSLVFRLLVGKALLRYSEKAVMMFGAVLFAATFIACILFRPFWPFFIVRLFQGISLASVDTAAFAFIVSIVPKIYLAKGLGYFLAAVSIAMALCPPFGMFLINHYSSTILFLICSGLSICAFLFSSILKKKESMEAEKRISGRKDSLLEWRVIAPAVVGFLHNFLWGAIMAFLPLYAIRSGITNPGLFFSAVAGMIITGRTLGGGILNACNKEKIILTFIVTSMVAMVVLSFSRSLPMFIVAGLLWGTASAFIFPANMAFSFEYAGSSSGTAIGTIRALMDLGLALGPMIMGIIVPFTGYRIMFLCLALICLINLTYFQFYVRKRR